MGLSTKELYLILRARDEASRVLRNVAGSIRDIDKQVAQTAQRNMQHGQALATMGVAIGGAAAMGVVALNNMTDAAIEYNKEAAKTMTQTDGLKTSVKELADIGRSVAKAIPAPFEEMQSTLYDIFSSMDVNVNGARRLLRQFARDAVGGQVDIQTAGRAVIEIMNAWEIPVKKVTRVSDVMFQLVRKGVGTYQEFARTIGRSIPSAVAAGQSIEDLAGGLAFLTRRGLSTAMASTAMGRAFDALANPKAIKALHGLGVEVVNAKGKFRPLVDIINDMNEKTANMSKPDKVKWLKDAFKGAGGTIQAMRFFNHALNDSNNLLDTLSASMRNAGGEAARAYRIMADTPAARIQLLHNRFEALRTEIGDYLIPVKDALVKVLLKATEIWDKMSPKVQKAAVMFALVVSVIGVLVGFAVALAGVFLMVSAALAVAEVGLAAILIPAGLVVAAIALLAAGAYLLIKNWDAISPVVSKVGGILKTYAVAAIQAVVAGAQWLWGVLKAVGAWLWSTFGPTLMRTWQSLKDSALVMWNAIKDAAVVAFGILKSAFGDFMTTMQQIWPLFSGLAKLLWDGFLKPLMILFGVVFVAAIKLALGLIAAAFSFLATVVSSTIGPLLSFVATVIASLWNIIKNFVGLVYSIFTGDWANAWNYAKALVASTFKATFNIINGAWNVIRGLVSGIVNGIINFFKTLYNVLVGHSIIPDLVNKILAWWNKLTALASRAAQFMSEVVGKFRSGFSTVLNLFSSRIRDIKDKFDGSRKWLVNAGENIIAGLKSGLSSALSSLSSWLSGRIAALKAKIASAKAAVKAGASKAAAAAASVPSAAHVKMAKGGWINEPVYGVGVHTGKSYSFAENEPELVVPSGASMKFPGAGGSGGTQIPITIYTQEIDPVKHAADLGWLLEQRAG